VAVSAAAVLAALATLVAAPAGNAAPASPAYAPLDQPGPALGVPTAALINSLNCEQSVKDAKVEPVLLNPATGVTPDENYSWNWEPALTKLGIPWCAYTAPHATLDNIETSGEYLVYAIRAMHSLAGRKIAIMGHSQGGMSMRWALRFWPDTRAMVDDVIGFSGSNHGTTVKGSACGSGCPPADWQQAADANFIKALNSYAETFPGISYTEIYTHTDEVVEPADNNQDASAALHTGGGMITNVATQDICPHDGYEHLTIGTVDPVAYALAVDALTHPGPANPGRIPRSVCSQALMPGIGAANLTTALELIKAAPTLASVAAGPLAAVTAGAPIVTSEPPLACYVFATCPATIPLTVSVAPKRVPARKRVRLRVRVTVDTFGVISPVPRATVTIGGRRVSTTSGGGASLRVRLARAGRRTIVATANEYLPGRATVKVTPAHH
jgi:hypothetical protein